MKTWSGTLHYLTNPHDHMNAAAADFALEGDFEFLILQLRMAEASPEVMALAADIIEGKVKRAKGKPKNSERTFGQRLDAALRVRKLERQGWGISESLLPAKSEIRFREPTVWEQYRKLILAAFAVFLLQATLIAWLIYERGRRQVAELESTAADI